MLDEYAARFPDDPAAHMRLLDAHFEREQWEEANADVEALAASFPDPFWDSIRGSIALKRGEHRETLRFAERLMEADPSLVDGPDLAVAAALGLGDMEKANVYAERLSDAFDIDLRLLAAQPGYEQIAELPAFIEPESEAPAAE